MLTGFPLATGSPWQRPGLTEKEVKGSRQGESAQEFLIETIAAALHVSKI